MVFSLNLVRIGSPGRLHTGFCYHQVQQIHVLLDMCPPLKMLKLFAMTSSCSKSISEMSGKNPIRRQYDVSASCSNQKSIGLTMQAHYALVAYNMDERSAWAQVMRQCHAMIDDFLPLELMAQACPAMEHVFNGHRHDQLPQPNALLFFHTAAHCVHVAIASE